MANDSHVAAVRAGNANYRLWRSSNPGETLDLSDAQLADANLDSMDLSGAVLDGANLDGTRLNHTNFSGASLRRATLRSAQASHAIFTNAKLVDGIITSARIDSGNFSGADLTNANFDNTNLQSSKFNGATIVGARFEQGALSGVVDFPVQQLRQCSSLIGVTLGQVNLRGVDLSGTDMRRAAFVGSDLTDSNMSEANLSNANLNEAKLIGANLTSCDLTSASCEKTDLSKARLNRSNLSRSRLTQTVFDYSDLAQAVFYEAEIDRASFFCTRNIDTALRLDTTRVANEIVYFDTLRFSFWNTYVSWEQLRSIGRLPLFGASYAALISIPFFYFGLDFYNEKIEIIRAWATQQLGQPGPHPLAAVIDAQLQQQPIPERSLWILFAAVALGIASTIYAMACPSRVKEFSKDQWRDQLGRPAFYYVSHSWRTLPLRVIAMGFYLSGGAVALMLIVEKMLQVLAFIVRNM